VALDAALPAGARPAALARGLTARVGLTAVVFCSLTVRLVAAAAHPVPRLFPDEYIYTAIARSLAHGHAPAVRGASAHFPALLAPLLAAPLQAVADPVTAYRLTQAENALFMSLAAVPVYLIARRLSLPTRHAFLCAIFAVAVPDLVYTAYSVADPAAYPLVLAAFAAGLAALERPRRLTQLLFLGFAGLATFDRVQYVVLPVAFFAASAFVDRRRMLARQRLPLVLCAVPAVAALAIGASRVLGYYSNVTNLHAGSGVLRWTASNLLLLAYASGMVLVPGAVVALARPRGRTERAFAALTVALALLLLFEASLFAANGSARFHERYLFTLLPLVPVAFGLYARRGYPAKRVVLLVAAALLVATVRVPLSGYIAGIGRFDSPFLNAVYWVQSPSDPGLASLGVALGAMVALVLAVAAAHRRAGTVALATGTVLVALASLGAIAQDTKEAQGVQRELVASDPSWIDDAHVGPVTMIQTQGGQPSAPLEQLYWNSSVDREVVLGNYARPTDAYAAPFLRARPDGYLANVTGSVLVHDWGATVRFQNEAVVARMKAWSLWSGSATPQLSLLEDGRFADGWVATTGHVTIWPDATGWTRGTLRFAMTLPRRRHGAVRIRFGDDWYRILPGRVTAVEYTIDEHGPFTLKFSAPIGHWTQDFRHVSVLSTAPTFTRDPGGAPAATTAA
jgi:hypothetical protein